MKTRMFDATKEPEFKWQFDAETLTGDGIATWFNQWCNNGGKKIPIPK
jgi:hypothetical protein